MSIGIMEDKIIVVAITFQSYKPLFSVLAFEKPSNSSICYSKQPWGILFMSHWYLKQHISTNTAPRIYLFIYLFMQCCFGLNAGKGGAVCQLCKI